MKSHSSTPRFDNTTFDYEILEESDDYEYIEDKEEYYIEKYDSFRNGLNESINGKGNHLCDTFTTNGFKYSEASRAKMSESAKARTDNNHMSQISKDMWSNPEMRKHMIEVRKGKRLREPIISDELVEECRRDFKQLSAKLQEKVDTVKKKNKRLRPTIESLFAQEYHKKYGMCYEYCRDIVRNKVRVEILPSI